jgi:hypothetical protein
MKGGGANGVLRRLKADETITVRFLEDPGEWVEAYYHWIGKNFIWCSQDKKCVGCVGGVKKGKTGIANALIVSSPESGEAGKVKAIQLPTTLADPLAARAEKLEERGRSITDHDIDLWRQGSGQNDTKYGFDPDDRKKRDLSRYESSLHDILQIIDSEIETQVVPSDDDAEEEEPRSTKRPAKKSRHEDEDDEYEDEDSEEDDDPIMGMDRTELKAEIRKIDPEFVFKKSQTDDVLREFLYDHQNEEEDDEEEEEEPPRRPAKKASTKPKSYRGLDEFAKPAAKKISVRRTR